MLVMVTTMSVTVEVYHVLMMDTFLTWCFFSHAPSLKLNQPEVKDIYKKFTIEVYRKIHTIILKYCLINETLSVIVDEIDAIYPIKNTAYFTAFFLVRNFDPEIISIFYPESHETWIYHKTVYGCPNKYDPIYTLALMI